MKRTLFLIPFLILLVGMVSMAWADTLQVGPGQTYTTIQAAINAAAENDVIQIAEGTYSEALSIGKSLTLIGSGPTDAPTTILTSTSNVINLTVTGKSFTFQNLIVEGNNSNLGIRAGSSIDIASITLLDFIGRNCKVAVYFSENYASGQFNPATVNNLSFDNVTLEDNTHIGAYIGKAVVNGVVTNSSFINNGYSDADAASYQKCGLQFVDFNGTMMPRVQVTNSTFTNNGGGASSIERTGLSFYTAVNSLSANDLLTVSGCSFSNHPQYAVRIRNGYYVHNTATVNGTFSNNYLDIWFNNVDGSTDTTTNVKRSLVGVKFVGPDHRYDYNTIQAAINGASNGNTIYVESGTYSENVIVNKSLTINGSNADTPFGSRVAGSIIAPASGLPVSIVADNVVLNGFEITAPGYQYAVNCGGSYSNIAIKYNYVHHIGTTVTGTNVHAIVYQVSNGVTPENLSITDNYIQYVSSSLLTGWSAAAIGVLQSSSTGILTGLNILRNEISHVEVNTGTWPTGKLAYGIILNTGSASYQTTTGKIVNAVVEYNNISDLTGFIATGIGMEGNTENASVRYNNVSNLTAYKLADRAGGGYDMNALKFETNRYIGTVTVQNNVLSAETFTHNGTPNRGYAVSNYVPSTVGVLNMSGNWYGSAVLAEILDNETLTGKLFNKAGCVSNFLPYSTSADPLNTLGVGPVVNETQGTSYLTIQAAIDAAVSGNVIQVATGIYQEQLHITTNNLSIIGSGKANTMILSPNILPTYFGTNSRPVVLIDGVSTVNIENLTINGNGAGNNNYRFIGMAFWNAGGVVDNVDVIGITETPFSGNQHGIGVYAYNDTSGPYTIAISNMVIDDYQKNAMALSGTGLTVDLNNITTIGAGPTAMNGQNGIQIGFGAGGTIDGCSVTGNIWTGTGNWAATGILIYNAAPVTVTNTNVINNYPGVYVQDSSYSMTGGSIVNTLPESSDGVFVYGYLARGDGRSSHELVADFKLAQPVTEDYSAPGNRAVYTVNLDGVEITGCENEDSAGYYVYAANNTFLLNVEDCEVSHWDNGMILYEDGGTIQLAANENQIYDNLDWGLYSNTAIAQDATMNWWGDNSGPFHASTNTGGLGNEVSDNVDYDPWWGDDTMEDLQSDIYVVNQTQNTIHPTIQAAINAATIRRNGEVIEVPAGTWIEDVLIDRTLTLRGADAATTIISGPIGGTSANTVTIAADNVIVENFTVTREGNNVTDWNNGALNSQGIIFNQAKTGGLVQNCIVTGNRNGIYLNNTTGHTIKNNLITNNRTGMQLVNNVTDCVIEDNEISDNWTMGILFYYSGATIATTGIQIEDNKIFGNWYSQIESKTNTGTNPTVSYDCSPNWFGMGAPYAVTTLAGEPGYAAQIPVEYGGNAVKPLGNEGKITGDLSALVLFNPWWIDEGMTILSSSVDLYVAADNELIQDGESQNYQVKVSNITNLRGFEIHISYPDEYFGAASNFLIGPAFTAAAAAAPDFGMTVLQPELFSAGNYKITGSFLGGIPEGGFGVSGTDVVLFSFDLAARVDVDNVDVPGYSVVALGDVVLKDIMNPYHEIGFDATTDKMIIIDAGHPTMVHNNAGTYTSPYLLPVIGDGLGLTDRPILDLTFTDNYNLDYTRYLILGVDDEAPEAIVDFTNALFTVDGLSINDVWQLTADVDLLDDGTYSVYFLVVDDANNFSIYDWDFIKDTTPPGAVVWDALIPCRTTAKENNKIDLKWANPEGTVKNHIWVLSYTDRVGGYTPPDTAYPEYPATANAISAAPDPYDSDPQNGWNQYILIDPPAVEAIYTLNIATRDYYYITIFAEDASGNISAAPAAPYYRESISYWPGDVALDTTPPAHAVESNDITMLSAVWGLADGHDDWNNIIDVGPTVDNGRRSRPTPDNVIDIEDLMIFAMNYNNTVYTYYPRDDDAPQIQPIRIDMQFATTGDKLFVDLWLGDNDGIVRGLNIPISYGSGLSFESLVNGDVWPDGSLILHKDKDNLFELSGSVLGGNSAITGNGILATVIFNITGDDTEIELRHMIARGIMNEEIEIVDNPNDVTTDNEDPVNVIPVVSYLGDNYPNPFNPSTTVRFGLSQAGKVRVSVYNTRGQLVRTLVNDNMQAGTHNVVWNGMDNSNRLVSSGIYFIRMETRDNVSTKKALMLK